MDEGTIGGLSSRTRAEVERLGRAVLSLRPLVDVLEHPVEVVPSTPGAGAAGLGSALPPDYVGVGELLDRVAERLGAPRFQLRPGAAAGELGTFTRVVSERLDLASFEDPEIQVPVHSLHEVDSIVDEVTAQSFEWFCTTAEVVADDGVSVQAYAAGQPGSPPVILASACGMPAKLCERWLRFLAQSFFVVTWESRGLFGGVRQFDGAACDVAAQAADLIAVMDRFELRRAHLMGICGGAVIALAAAARRPERASSLSLWHGDFELGADGSKTPHQQNLKALMSMATEGRVSPADLHRVVCRSMIRNVPPALAHLVLYPYATAELLARYCRLNGSIMSTDVHSFLDEVAQPTLVVTSTDDQTAHPAGSEKVAAALPDATLHVAPHGDHLSLFNAEPGLMQLAASFIARQRR